MALGITGAVGPKVAAPEGVIVVAGPLRFVRDIAESFVVVGAAVAFAVGASPSPVCGVGDAKDGGGRDAPVVMVVAGLVRLALLLFFVCFLVVFFAFFLVCAFSSSSCAWLCFV